MWLLAFQVSFFSPLRVFVVNPPKFPMKALLLTEYRHLELADMPTPEIGDRRAAYACGVRHLRQRHPWI